MTEKNKITIGAGRYLLCNTCIRQQPQKFGDTEFPCVAAVLPNDQAFSQLLTVQPEITAGKIITINAFLPTVVTQQGQIITCSEYLALTPDHQSHTVVTSLRGTNVA